MCIFCFLFANHCCFCPVEWPVSVPCVSAFQCAVLSGETKQLAARRPGSVKKHQSSCNVSHQELCLHLCQSTGDFFFFCRRSLRLRGGLDATCRLSTAFFPYFPPKLFIPATLALTRRLSGWNSSGLKVQSWQQATTHQLGSAVTERGKQKMRYKVTGGWSRGGGESVIVLELHSLPSPIRHWRLSKNGILSCSRFSFWPRWLVVTQATSGCAITRLHPVHICPFEERDIDLKVKHLPHSNYFLLTPIDHMAHMKACAMNEVTGEPVRVWCWLQWDVFTCSLVVPPSRTMMS